MPIKKHTPEEIGAKLQQMGCLCFLRINARLRDELLNGEIVYTLAQARIVIESWLGFYNTRRPHGSLGYRPPAQEVFIPHSALAAALPQPVSPPALAPRPPMH